MIRKAFYIREDQIKTLKSLPGSEAEHVRAAIDAYIEKIKKDLVSASPSKIKEF